MTPEQNAHVKTLTTAEEIFDYVEAHLRNQGQRSMARSCNCAYRGEKGRMCAVGCLIADDEYNLSMEGNVVCAIHLPFRLRPHVSMLRDLQIFHDYEGSWDHDRSEVFSPEGEDRLEKIRVEFDLKKTSP